jgi:hypothetical protein
MMMDWLGSLFSFSGGQPAGVGLKPPGMHAAGGMIDGPAGFGLQMPSGPSSGLRIPPNAMASMGAGGQQIDPRILLMLSNGLMARNGRQVAPMMDAAAPGLPISAGQAGSFGAASPFGQAAGPPQQGMLFQPAAGRFRGLL